MTKEQEIYVQILWNSSDERIDFELSIHHPVNKKYLLERIIYLGLNEEEELPIESKEAAKEVKKEIETYVSKNKDELTNTICKKLNYCEKRKLLDKEGWKVAIAVFDSLIASATQIPIPILLFSVYLTKYKILDVICKCDN